MDVTWKCAHEGYSSSMETADISYDNAIKKINDYGTQAGSQPWTIGTSTTSLWQQCERQVQILWHGGGNGGTYCITMSIYRGSQGEAARSLHEGEAGIQTRQHIQRESRAISTREISTQDHHEARLIQIVPSNSYSVQNLSKEKKKNSTKSPQMRYFLQIVNIKIFKNCDI